MFNKIRQRSKEIANYTRNVEEYINRKGIKVLIELCNNQIGVLNAHLILKFVGDDFPKNSRIDKADIVNQFVSMLEAIGYEYADVQDDIVCLNANGTYSRVVQSYLRNNGSELLNDLSESCQRTNGRIGYWELSKILSEHFPKAIKSLNIDKRLNAIIFFKETGLPIRFDEDYVYFP